MRPYAIARAARSADGAFEPQHIEMPVVPAVFDPLDSTPAVFPPLHSVTHTAPSLDGATASMTPWRAGATTPPARAPRQIRAAGLHGSIFRERQRRNRVHIEANRRAQTPKQGEPVMKTPPDQKAPPSSPPGGAPVAPHEVK